MTKPTLRCPCAGQFCREAFRYDAPPEGETKFAFEGEYRRAYSRCEVCGHWFSENAMDLAGLYGGAYVDSTYGQRMRETFERIIGLPPDRSDNTGRVARIVSFAAGHFPAGTVPRLLDVGAGLSVFAYRMKAAGWHCTALDPDPRAAAHARETVGVAAITADFMDLDPVGLEPFDVVTLNKVLEHVEDPVAMLQRAARLLAGGGFVYFEVPDGEAAADEGKGREEFFIEHHHVFSPASVAMMTERAGMRILTIERLCEPSGKFTLRGFAAKEGR